MVTTVEEHMLPGEGQPDPLSGATLGEPEHFFGEVDVDFRGAQPSEAAAMPDAVDASPETTNIALEPSEAPADEVIAAMPTAGVAPEPQLAGVEVAAEGDQPEARMDIDTEPGVAAHTDGQQPPTLVEQLVQSTSYDNVAASEAERVPGIASIQPAGEAPLTLNIDSVVDPMQEFTFEPNNVPPGTESLVAMVDSAHQDSVTDVQVQPAVELPLEAMGIHPILPQGEGNLQQAVLEAASVQPDVPASEPLLAALAGVASPSFVPTLPLPAPLAEGEMRYCVTCGNQIQHQDVCFAEQVAGQFNYYCKGCAQDRRQTGQTELVVITKKCAKCGEVKAAQDFNRYGRNSEGLHSYCKICSRKDSKTRREKFPPVETPTVDHQVCSVCKEDKPASEFTRDKTRRTGLSHRCRSCKVQQNARCCERRATQPKQIPETKVCSCCNVKKPSFEFWKRPTSTDGLRSECKSCSAKRYRQWLSKVGTEVTVETKVCKTCGMEKPAAEFHKNNQRHDGLEANCAVCRTAVRARRRPPPPVPSKICQKCFQLKDASEFKRKSSMPDGLVKTCKECCQKSRSSKKSRSGKSSDEGMSDALGDQQMAGGEMMAEHQCSGCKMIKTADQFNKRKCTRTGLDWYCKACTVERAKKRRRQGKGEGGEHDQGEEEVKSDTAVAMTLGMALEAAGDIFAGGLGGTMAMDGLTTALLQPADPVMVVPVQVMDDAPEPPAKRARVAEDASLDTPYVQVHLVPDTTADEPKVHVHFTHIMPMAEPQASFTEMVHGSADFALASPPDHTLDVMNGLPHGIVAAPLQQSVGAAYQPMEGVEVADVGMLGEGAGIENVGGSKFQAQLDNLSKLQEQLRSVLEHAGAREDSREDAVAEPPAQPGS